MKLFSKTILACSIAAASLFAGASAQAADFNPFTVQPDAPATGDTKGQFSADKITGGYNERITFGPNNTFFVSLFWQAGQFYTDEGSTLVSSNVSGLGTDYGLYATYKASGTVSTVGGKTTFNFDPSSAASLSFTLDKNNDTVKTANAATGTGDVTLINTTDDIQLGYGSPLSGAGALDLSLSTCSAGGGKGINCGSFGSATTFALTTAGSAFFVLPTPFYTLSFQSGQLNNFPLSGTQTVNGSLDVVFDNEVPEPASLGLMGLGLLGLGFLRARKQS